jgi:hypothetical protein
MMWRAPYFDLRSGLFVPSFPVDAPFGPIVRSARSRSCRAIAIRSPVSTSLAASSRTSCCAERISPSMMSMARSLRCSRPATRYQIGSARARGSIPANALDGLAVDAAPLDHSRAVIRAEWQVIGRPYSYAGGKMVHARVQYIWQPATVVVWVWGAHEKVSVRRA